MITTELYQFVYFEFIWFLKLVFNGFQLTGKDYINQLKLIIGVLGSPEQDLLDLCQSDLIKKFIIRKLHMLTIVIN